MNVIQHLVLTNGKLLMKGMCWADVGVPLYDLSVNPPQQIDASNVAIFLITFASEIAQLGEDDEARDPAYYKLLLVKVDATGTPKAVLPKDETFVCEIMADKVAMCFRTQHLGDALLEFRQLIEAENPAKDDPPSQPVASATTPS